MTETRKGFLARLMEGKTATSKPRTGLRVVLGAMLAYAGVSHVTVARQEFQAQVPKFVPLDPDFVVVASGIAEMTLGAALIFLARRRVPVGWPGGASPSAGSWRCSLWQCFRATWPSGCMHATVLGSTQTPNALSGCSSSRP